MAYNRLVLGGNVGNRYFNPAGRNVSGSLSNVLSALSNRQTQAQQRKESEMRLGALDEDRSRQALVQDFAEIYSLLEAGETEQALETAYRRLEAAKRLGKDTSHTEDLIRRMESNPDSAKAGLRAVLDSAAGYYKRQPQPASMVEFNMLTEIAENASGQYSPGEQQAALIRLGRAPRAVGSAAQTTATTPGMTEIVAGSEGTIAESKGEGAETGKLRAQRLHLPEVRRLVKLAEKEAEGMGETAVELAQMEAAMPTLLESVNDLGKLADIATYTLTGRAFDEMTKQLGFGSTKGANARAKFVSIVDNQVLPLLKQTFGSAFTEAEGNRLRDALVDPNSTPEQKKLQLEAFVTQKARNIQSGQRELQVPVTPIDELLQRERPASGKYTIIRIEE